MTFRLYYYFVNAFGVYTQNRMVMRWQSLSPYLQLCPSQSPLSSSQSLPATQKATAPKELPPPLTQKTLLTLTRDGALGSRGSIGSGGGGIAKKLRETESLQRYYQKLPPRFLGCKCQRHLHNYNSQ